MFFKYKKIQLKKYFVFKTLKSALTNLGVMATLTTAIIAYYQYHVSVEKEKIITTDKIRRDMHSIEAEFSKAKEICMENDRSPEKKLELKSIKDKIETNLRDKIETNLRDIASTRSALMEYFGDSLIKSAIKYIQTTESISNEIPKCSGQINEDSFLNDTKKIRYEFQEEINKNMS